MSVQTQTMPGPITTKTSSVSGFHITFIVAWAVCLLFYFLQYAVRSAPSVMMPELTTAYGLTTLSMSSLLGMYYYTYSTFALVSGASLDRWGAKYTIPIGIFFLGSASSCSCRRSVGSLCWSLVAGSRCRLRLRWCRVSGDPWVSGALSRDCDRLHAVPRHARRIGRPGSASAPLVHGVMSWQQFWLLCRVSRAGDHGCDADRDTPTGSVRAFEEQHLAHV